MFHYQFHSKIIMINIDDNYIILIVAPNDYCTEKVNIDKSPEYSFGLKSVLDKPSDIPGN